VLCPGWAERLKGRRELSPRSALFFSGLLTARPGTDHLTADLEVDPVVLDFVLGGGPVRDDDGAAAPGLDDLVVSPDERAAARQVTGYLGRVPRPGPGAAVVVISGPPGVGRRTCAEAICRMQGPSGQWWWHYDARNGRIFERYPVYAVHQDGMAPMALFALGEVARLDFSEPIYKGLAWISGNNELPDRRSSADATRR